MPHRLKVLIVEDSAADAELLARELERGDFSVTWQRVETEADFLNSLENSPDVILSDCSMPKFDGMRALDLLRERDLDIPFILISGTMGEEAAVEAMRRGATDYLLKDRMGRLNSAVSRALTERDLRGEQRRLRQQLALHSTALETAASGVVITDRAGKILWVNAAFTESTGYAPGEVIGRTPRVLKSGQHPEEFYKQFWKTLLSGQTWRGEFINRRKNGEIYYDEHTVTPVRNKDGEITHFVGMMHDITPRKEAEAALRESESRFRELAENIQEVFWIFDPVQNRMLYISPGFETVWGCSSRDVLASPCAWFDSIHPEDRQRVEEAANAKRARGTYDEIYRIKRPDGSIRWIHDRAFPIRNSAGEVCRIVGTAIDVTVQHNLEQQFRQIQKMESIGQLAGGVAHDFNNILAVVQGHASLLLSYGKLDAEGRESAEQICLAAERAAALSRQLLTFSRKQVVRLQKVDINDIVTNLAKMLKRMVGDDVSVKLHSTAGLPLIHADIGMIEQVLMNLAVNARDAMPRGGQLIIATSEEIMDEAYCELNPDAKPGRYICLSVSDVGCGIPQEHLSRIFEPFFTTKEAGKGTGLGLATVYGIVQQHRGWIKVYSELGKGTTFHIYLPAIEGKEDSQIQASPKPAIRGGNETLMVVEDETSLRALVRNLLERHGYTVLEAESGKAALEVWRQRAAKVDLLFTDMVMPDGVTGQDLAKRLREEQPSLKVIFASGYSAEIVGKNLVLEEGVDFLQKPYNPGRLLEAVRTSLDRK